VNPVPLSTVILPCLGCSTMRTVAKPMEVQSGLMLYRKSRRSFPPDATARFKSTVFGAAGAAGAGAVVAATGVSRTVVTAVGAVGEAGVAVAAAAAGDPARWNTKLILRLPRSALMSPAIWASSPGWQVWPATREMNSRCILNVRPSISKVAR